MRVCAVRSSDQTRRDYVIFTLLIYAICLILLILFNNFIYWIEFKANENIQNCIADGNLQVSEYICFNGNVNRVKSQNGKLNNLEVNDTVIKSNEIVH